jgi:hypothetical protein
MIIQSSWGRGVLKFAAILSLFYPQCPCIANNAMKNPANTWHSPLTKIVEKQAPKHSPTFIIEPAKQPKTSETISSLAGLIFSMLSMKGYSGLACYDAYRVAQRSINMAADNTLGEIPCGKGGP